MMQATLSRGPLRSLDTERPRHTGLLTMFRIPKPGDAIPDDLRHLLEENDLFEEDGDDRDKPIPSAPPAGLATGMAFCIPAMMVIGLLYALLK